MSYKERTPRQFTENSQTFSREVAAIIVKDAVTNQQNLATALETLEGPDGTDYAAQLLGNYTSYGNPDQRILALAMRYSGININSSDLRVALVEVLREHLGSDHDTTTQ